MRRSLITVVVAFSAVSFAAVAVAQVTPQQTPPPAAAKPTLKSIGMMIYPAKGQSPSQQAFGQVVLGALAQDSDRSGLVGSAAKDDDRSAGDQLPHPFQPVQPRGIGELQAQQNGIRFLTGEMIQRLGQPGNVRQ